MCLKQLHFRDYKHFGTLLYPNIPTNKKLQT